MEGVAVAHDPNPHFSPHCGVAAADGERLSAAEGARLLREGSMFELGLAASITKAMPSTASPRAFTPVWCSMNAIISTVFFIRSG